jgi:hypothetical protein
MSIEVILPFLARFEGPLDMEIGQLTLLCRDRGFITTEAELKACEELMNHPRMSHEVYVQLRDMVRSYQSQKSGNTVPDQMVDLVNTVMDRKGETRGNNQSRGSGGESPGKS